MSGNFEKMGFILHMFWKIRSMPGPGIFGLAIAKPKVEREAQSWGYAFIGVKGELSRDALLLVNLKL